MRWKLNIDLKIAQELNITEKQVGSTIKLIDEGNTIPFISRYRKEVTGNLTDEDLRSLEELLTYLRSLEQRKADVIRLIEEQDKLTPELKEKIEEAEQLKEVEDLYLPYKQKKRTRATKAREKGLEPLSKLMLNQDSTDEEFETLAKSLVDEEKGVESFEDAVQSAMDIIAERVSETISFRDIVRDSAKANGGILSSQNGEDPSKTYEMYYDFLERLKHLKPHRILAMFRGEKEGVLKLKFDLNDAENIQKILQSYENLGDKSYYPYIQEAVIDGYKRLLLPSIETEVKNELKERADRESIKVFGKNLKPYLMQPPIKDCVVLGIDPGYRTGCKVAVISSHGKLLDYKTIYPTKPREDIHGSKKILKDLIEKYQVNLISIGNGTASRETENLVSELIEELKKKDLFYTIVNEAGASIYSASKLGQEEFPELDVTIRGAVSIARRIQDPLAELVKIDPEHLGVGQYQHDVNQKELKETLSNVVEDCVNSVGVNVNTSSAVLLNYVSGISKSVAKNIVEYKEQNGPFKNREELNKVKGLGPKAFTQCAGFLRIPDSENVLDNTAVHPESYDIAKELLNRDLKKVQVSRVSVELDIGVPTLVDIIKELKKPGRDPRDEMPKPILRSDVLSIEDLTEGMVLKGTVRNVVDFGLFVDIGIKNDGLVHISEMSDKFIKHPSDMVEVSDIVEVKIISIEKETGRVGLSMKGI